MNSAGEVIGINVAIASRGRFLQRVVGVRRRRRGLLDPVQTPPSAWRQVDCRGRQGHARLPGRLGLRTCPPAAHRPVLLRRQGALGKVRSPPRTAGLKPKQQ
ncbi:hypothetical protein QJS66_22585 [Kocuria rhizophila]|nr:hypothetical protein QJS66_22585 [Kocuria rhizophila]